MAALQSRPFSKPEDLQAMTALLRRLRDAGQVVYPIATDLHEELDDADARASARLWENEQGDLLGFSYVSTWQNLVDAFRDDAFTPDGGDGDARLGSPHCAGAQPQNQQHRHPRRQRAGIGHPQAGVPETERFRAAGGNLAADGTPVGRTPPAAPCCPRDSSSALLQAKRSWRITSPCTALRLARRI